MTGLLSMSLVSDDQKKHSCRATIPPSGWSVDVQHPVKPRWFPADKLYTVLSLHYSCVSLYIRPTSVTGSPEWPVCYTNSFHSWGGMEYLSIPIILHVTVEEFLSLHRQAAYIPRDNKFSPFTLSVVLCFSLCLILCNTLRFHSSLLQSSLEIRRFLRVWINNQTVLLQFCSYMCNYALPMNLV